MPPAIVDTNVLMVANGTAEQVSVECRQKAIQLLNRLRREGILVLDNQWEIVQEYKRNVSPSGQPGVGDAFLKWVLTNLKNSERCRLVPIAPDSSKGYREFPDDPALNTFDRDDRKFVAVAISHRNLHGEVPPIWNATSDWWLYRHALEDNGLLIEFLCDEQVHRWQQNLGS